MNRRQFFQTALAVGGFATVAKGGVAADHFEEWLQARNSIDHFVSNYFQVRGEDGQSCPAHVHRWLNIIADGDMGNRYLLKLKPGEEVLSMLAAAVAHRLVFFSDIHVGLLADGDVSKKLADRIAFGLAMLPAWMFAVGSAGLPENLILPNGNRLTVFRAPGRERFSDLLIYGVDRVPQALIRGSVLAARGGFVVMTTAKQRYRAPVDCVELRPGAFDGLFGALEGR